MVFKEVVSELRGDPYTNFAISASTFLNAPNYSKSSFSNEEHVALILREVGSLTQQALKAREVEPIISHMEKTFKTMDQLKNPFGKRKLRKTLIKIWGSFSIRIYTLLALAQTAKEGNEILAEIAGSHPDQERFDFVAKDTIQQNYYRNYHISGLIMNVSKWNTEVSKYILRFKNIEKRMEDIQ